jgi:3',5'-cyclic AMP phosphodiesterase CpdA
MNSMKSMKRCGGYSPAAFLACGAGAYDRPMASFGGSAGSLLAVGDLHITYPENRRVLESLRAFSRDDWLIVCGDVSEMSEEVEWALGLLRERFATVIWTPGNHELWTTPQDPLQLRGEHRYRHLVEQCRRIGVLTPEDPYPLWEGPGGPAIVAPLFLLYDYSFGSNIAPTAAQALARAHAAGVVCSDELVLYPDPHPTREAWCRERVAQTESRLSACDAQLPTVLVNHFPLIRDPTSVLRHPEFAQWCGTTLTADWHRRFRAQAVVYGHLHIPRVTWYDGVRFEEVSLRYAKDWDREEISHAVLRRILPRVAS